MQVWVFHPRLVQDWVWRIWILIGLVDYDISIHFLPEPLLVYCYICKIYFSVEAFELCRHLNKCYWVVLSGDSVSYAHKLVLAFAVGRSKRIPRDHSQKSYIKEYFSVVLLSIMLYKLVTRFESVNEFSEYNRSNQMKLLRRTFLRECLFKIFQYGIFSCSLKELMKRRRAKHNNNTLLYKQAIRFLILL